MQQLSIYPDYKITKPIKLIELFGGIGSQAKALENLGALFIHHKVVEFDKHCINSYNAIHSTSFEPLDITKISARDLDIREREKWEYIITYSFPCQDLSLAGKGKGMAKGSGTRSGLLWEVERLLKECGEELPQVLLMENVPQVISKNNVADFNMWLNFLTSKGYSNFYQILNAKDYGIPQNRRRCFMVSILGEYNYTFPEGKPLTLRLKDLCEDEVEERYYLNEKMQRYILNRTPLGEKGNYAINIIGNDKEKVAGTVTAIAITNDTDIKETKNYIQWKQKGFLDIDCRAYKEESIAPTTITTPKTKILLEDLQIRKLTPKECWRLMGFDDEDYEKASNVCSITQLYKQAGNSIVVNVLEAIFKELL